MNPHVTRLSALSLRPAKLARHLVLRASVIVSIAGCPAGASLAAAPDPGRLFYTPAQRAQLEAARTHHVAQHPSQTQEDTPDSAPAPLRFDGQVTRSDGKTTRWVNGKAQLGASSVPGLKPGQIRADGKVYEPYQILRPNPGEDSRKDPAP